MLDHDLCRKAGGRFLLRIEDIDPARCRPKYEAAIHADLRWLGIEWEEPVRRQSEHMDAYKEAMARLSALGVVYPSFMSRAEIQAAMSADAPRDPDGAPLYPGLDRTLDREEAERRVAAGEPHSLRIRIDRARGHVRGLSFIEEGAGPKGERGVVIVRPEIWGDFVIARKEVPTSYHLAVVVDDALQGVTHVVRGRDLFHATAAHVLLQRLLGLPSPLYHHHRLITDADGRKLAKSDRDTSLGSLREAGATPADIRRMVGL